MCGGPEDDNVPRFSGWNGLRAHQRLVHKDNRPSISLAEKQRNMIQPLGNLQQDVANAVAAGVNAALGGAWHGERCGERRERRDSSLDSGFLRYYEPNQGDANCQWLPFGMSSRDVQRSREDYLQRARERQRVHPRIVFNTFNVNHQILGNQVEGNSDADHHRPVCLGNAVERVPRPLGEPLQIVRQIHVGPSSIIEEVVDEEEGEIIETEETGLCIVNEKTLCYLEYLVLKS